MRAELPKTILPRAGAGPLRFGLSRADVRELLGDPSEPADLSIAGWEIWTYGYHAIEVTFCEDADWRCTRLWTDDPSYLLGGRVVLGIPLVELSRLSSTLELGPCIARIDPDLSPALDFPEADVEISLRNDISDYITWHAQIDSRDEYVFPAAEIPSD